MAKKMSHDDFINRCFAIHGNKYDYSKTVYTHSHGNITILCRKHGEFIQKAYAHYNGAGCLKCQNSAGFIFNRKSERKAKLLEKFKEFHGNYYDYSQAEFINSKVKIKIVCPKHGEFMQTPCLHSKGMGCQPCAKDKAALIYRQDREKVIQKFIEVHGRQYDYSKFKYSTNNKTKSVIVCQHHGEFLQSANHHGRGAGCPECAKYLSSPFKRETYARRCQNKYKGLSYLYILRVFDEHEQFYKVGISCKPIAERYRQRMPYKYEVIYRIKGKAGEIWDLEKSIKTILRPHRKIPVIKFAGYTECFSEITADVREMLNDQELLLIENPNPNDVPV